MARNAVFLDIDGVLNSLSSVLALGGWRNRLDPVCVRLVERLVVKADAKIIVSSSWRIGRTVETLKQELATCGARCLAKHIIDITPVHDGDREDADGNHIGRGLEIKEWISRVDYRGKYVIIDDDSDFLPEQKKFFVHTSQEDGFRAKHYKKAMSILAPEHADSRIYVREGACL